MKIDDNGDFCLLYVEPADEKQRLFETIGAQTKPVVLMPLLEPGQSRPKLFQRPEDFSDLKHVRRQTGVTVIFLTAGSERLVQLAARYGFPAYASIDAFADALIHGRRSATEEGEASTHAVAQRLARTGPLLSSAIQQAALRRQHATESPPVQAFVDPLSNSTTATATVEKSAAVTAPLNELQEPEEIVFWPDVEPVPPLLVNGHDSSPQQGRMNGHGSSPQQRRVNGHHTPIPPAREVPADASVPEPPPYQGEIPARRSAVQSHEHAMRHPSWESAEHLPDTVATISQEHHQPARYDYMPQAFPEHTQPMRPNGVRSAPDLPGYPARTASSPDMPVLPRRASATRSSPDHFAPITPVPPTLRKRRSLVPVLLLLSVLIIGGAGLGSFVAISRTTPPATVPPVVVQSVGSIAFVSSGQINGTTSQGIDDQVQITLHNLGTPASGKSYYAWLLGDADQAESQSILLGKLNVVHGNVSVFYPGDTQHTNLLQIGSRFLITEEDSTTIPLIPSPDISTWRYYGALPATPDPNDPHHFAFINHLRHLLADEPVLDELGLPGGLNNWFTRNTQKLVEWTTSARDAWQQTSTHSVAQVRSEAISVLSYLDGMSFLPLDMPPASQNMPVQSDTQLAGLGLLNIRGLNQNPPSYIDQIVYHLNGLIDAPGSPATVRTTAAALLPDMSNVTTWLQNLRSDDKQLLAMTNAQLGQPAASSLLDDMVLQASNAYTGNTDPSTGKLRQGVAAIHQQLQSIATITVNPYTSGRTMAPELGPQSLNMPTFAPALLDVRRPL